MIFTGSYCGARVNEHEMGGACGMHCRLRIYEVLSSAQEELRCLALFSEMVSLLIS